MSTHQSAPLDKTSSKPPNPTTETPQDVSGPKTDEITAVQDSIDRLSLAMFEALRGLRDAVAPESGNLAASNTNGTTTENESMEPSLTDFEEFYQSVHRGDEKTVAIVKKASGGVLPHKREDLLRIHAKLEAEKDIELVARLASTVLQRSAEVDARVTSLPGMHRTRTEQMRRIEELLGLNQQVAKELEETYSLASDRRNEVRATLRKQTGRALGIEEEIS